MENEKRKVIFSLYNNQFSVLLNENFLIPKHSNITSAEDISNNANVILLLGEENWEKDSVKLIFEEPTVVRGKKVIHFRVARRNSRHKKKGFRATYLETKILSIL